MRGSVVRLDFAQTAARQFAVVKIAETLRKFLVVGARHGRIVVFFRQAGRASTRPRESPPKSGYKPDLLLKSGLGFGGPALAQAQPCHLPVRVRSAACVGKALLQLPISIDRLVVVGLEQIEIAGRKQRLLQPQAGGSGLAQLSQVAQEPILVAAAASDLSQVVKPLGVDFRRSSCPASPGLSSLPCPVRTCATPPPEPIGCRDGRSDSPR